MKFCNSTAGWGGYRKCEANKSEVNYDKKMRVVLCLLTVNTHFMASYSCSVPDFRGGTKI